MGFIVLNPESLNQFQHVGEPTELRDASGRVVGFFNPMAGHQVDPPFSHDEIEEDRKQRTGRPLEEILKGLPRRGLPHIDLRP